MDAAMVPGGTQALSPGDALDRLGAGYDRKSKSDATWKAYNADWRNFRAWCTVHDRPSMPATPETVALYVADLASRGLKPSTIARRLHGIAAAHSMAGQPNPCDARVRLRMSGIRRARPAPRTVPKH